MQLENYIDTRRVLGASGLFSAIGSFGIIDGAADYTCAEAGDVTTYTYTDGSIRLQAEFTKEKNGVVIRRDSFTNCSQATVTLRRLMSRFRMSANDYDVYTQYNGWQHESEGAWQRLVSEIAASAQGIRTCEGATPILALHSRYTEKNTVFHLLPNAQWRMAVKKIPESDRELVVVETGFDDTALSLRVEVGERIELPTVIFFEAESKRDLDAYKLHRVYNRLYPRKTLPVLYNSWLATFDRLDIDELMREADTAADMGIEAFMVDAGWFGTGDDWWKSVGDWQENRISGPKGRLLELSQHVRARGMIFGLWFEPERAAKDSNAVKTHPEYYINGEFLDFANPDARAFILSVIGSHIEKYRVGWLKFDFNASIPTDPSGNAFYRYMQGQRAFIEALRAKYPHLYITNCASGGGRMELYQATMFDSFWLSDNQGPYDGIRIVKDTLKRMPTGAIERWNVQKYCEDFLSYGEENRGRMIHCNDATWDFLVGVRDAFSEGFMMGGPLGFSCRISDFPEHYRTRWAEVIARYKEEREFYRTAVAHILVDTDAILAVEYADPEMSTCILQVFTRVVHAKELIVYPAVTENAVYRVDGKERDARDIVENGVFVDNLISNSCVTLKLEKA